MDFTKDIYINKDTIYEDSEMVLLYKGFLFSNNLANEVYISYGYGNLWDNKEEILMKPSTFGYLATLKIGSGENLQFCFRDNYGNWDNNNNQNYILPIKENENVLSFKSLSDTCKEVSFEVYQEPETITKKEIETNVLEQSVVSSNAIELYQTVDLENITKQAIPDDTIVTQINLNADTANTVSNAVIKSPEPEETVSEAFEKLTEKAKEQSATAFDEDKVTAGSVYVNSIIQDTPKVVENISEETSLVTKSEGILNTVTNYFKTFAQTVKSAFNKVVKLIKTTFNFGENEN